MLAYNFSKNLNLLTIILGLTVGGCAPDAAMRSNIIQKEAETAKWSKRIVRAAPFQIATFMPQQIAPTDTVYVYIEGDGLAWRDSATPSSNPTPVNPVSLQLALRHGAGAAYIGRPCQYTTDDPACATSKWWTSHRFAPEVISSTSLAIDTIKQAYHAQHVNLIGYSGGGAVVALVAAKRTDVIALVTVAGNLDTDAWTKLHGVKPLTGSLNPANDWVALQTIPQIHYVGADDKNVPLAVAESYQAHFPASSRPTIRVMRGFNHSCCWADVWKADFGVLK